MRRRFLFVAVGLMLLLLLLPPPPPPLLILTESMGWLGSGEERD
jgi:hypothetical protein